MPHCIIEHSSEFNSDIIMSRVLSGTLASGLFDASGRDIKIRAIPYNYYQTGEDRKAFIHVTLKILSGRNKQQKQKLSELVLEQLKPTSLVDTSLVDTSLVDSSLVDRTLVDSSLVDRTLVDTSLEDSSIPESTITIEVTDMDKETYSKFVHSI